MEYNSRKNWAALKRLTRRVEALEARPFRFGTSNIRYGNGAPDLPGAGMFVPTIYYDLDTNTWYFLDTVNQLWIVVSPANALGFYIFESVAALQAGVVVGQYKLAALVMGFNAAGDNQPAFYRWDAASLESQLDAQGNQRLDVVKLNAYADLDAGRFIMFL